MPAVPVNPFDKAMENAPMEAVIHAAAALDTNLPSPALDADIQDGIPVTWPTGQQRHHPSLPD